MAHATHSNAALTVRSRLRIARLIVDDGWPVARAAERYDVSWKTAAKWARRYQDEGIGGMYDRSSRPRHQPNKTPPHVVRTIVRTRLRQRLGPIEIGAKLDLPASTVHAVLTRCHLNRLTHIDRATGEQPRRYEHARPGDLIHVDVKKLGRVPDGGGHRYVGRVQGGKNRIATVNAGHATRGTSSNPRLGTCYLHTVIDDHSRVAYVEAHADEKKETAATVLRNAVAWFAARGVTRPTSAERQRPGVGLRSLAPGAGCGGVVRATLCCRCDWYQDGCRHRCRLGASTCSGSFLEASRVSCRSYAGANSRLRLA